MIQPSLGLMNLTSSRTMEPAREEGAEADVRIKVEVLVTTASTITSAPTVRE